MNCNIHMFGSANGIGKWLTLNVFSKKHQVFAYDIDEKVKLLDKSISIKPCHLNINEVNYLDKYKDNFSKNDFFIFAVPETALRKLLQEISKYDINGLFICATSVQEKSLNLISSILPGMDILGFHPLFGHLIENPYGHLTALCNFDEKNNKHTYFKSLVKEEGLSVSTLTAKEHDKAMSYVQALTHFQYLAFFKLFSKMNISMDTLLKVKTPPFENLSAFASRIFNGNPLTYASIQNNSNAHKVRKEFIDICNELNESFELNDLNNSTSEIEEIKKSYPKYVISELSNFSIQSINAVQEKEELYHKIKRKKNYFLFKTNSNSKVKIGKLTHINNKTLTLNVCETTVQDSDKILTPFPFNYYAFENYEKDGIYIKEKTNVEIKKSNFILLSEEESQKWMKQNLYYVTRRTTFHLVKTINDPTFERLLPKLVKGLVKCSFIQLSKKKGFNISVVLDLTIHPSFNFNQIKKNIDESLLTLSKI